MMTEHYPRPTWIETDEYFLNEKRIREAKWLHDLNMAAEASERFGDDECERFQRDLLSQQTSKPSE